MGQWLGHLRHQPPFQAGLLNRLGAVKYGLALSVAALAGGLAFWTQPLGAAPLALAAFYCVEAQMVFLFPLALDGASRPFRESRQWTVRAGDTVRAYGTAPLAPPELTLEIFPPSRELRAGQSGAIELHLVNRGAGPAASIRVNVALPDSLVPLDAEGAP